MEQDWIDLLQYSLKYGVSQSTIRRRIRSRSIPFQLKRGKYLLPDNPEVFETAPLFSRIPVMQKAQEPSKRLGELEAENRKLKQRIAELETLVNILDQGSV